MTGSNTGCQISELENHNWKSSMPLNLARPEVGFTGWRTEPRDCGGRAQGKGG